MPEAIVYKISQDGAEQTAAGFDRVAAAMDRTVKLQSALAQAQSDSGVISNMAKYRAEADQVNDVVGKLTKSVEESGRAFGASGRTIQEAGTTIGRIGAELGGLGQYRGVIDTLSRSVFMFASTVIGGPEIAIAGGAIGAVAGITLAFQHWVPDIDAVSYKITRGSLDIADYTKNVAALRTQLASGFQQGRSDRAKDAAIGQGNASSDELLAQELAEKSTIRDYYTKKVTEIHGKNLDEVKVRSDEIFDRMQARLAQVDEKFNALRSTAAAVSKNEADKAELAAQLSTQSPLIGKDIAPGKAPKGVDSFKLEEEREKQLEKLNALEEQYHLKTMAAEQAMADQKLKIQEIISTNDQKNEQLKQQEADNTFRQQMQAEEQLFQAKQKHFQLERQERQIINSAIQQTAGIVAGGTAKMLTAVAEGQKVSGAAILKSIGESMIAEGTMAVFSGIIDLASFNPAGAVKIATGGAEIAAGIGFAGVGAAATPATPSAPSSASQAGSSPINNSSGSSGSSSPTIIYISMPSVVSPSADDGLRVREALKAANNSYGVEV